MPVLRTKTNRMWLPDALRGLALLNMLVYHGMYDWVYVFGHASRWYDIWAPGCHVWQQYICWSFIVLSGFSFPLARKPVKNGLLVAGCAAVLTVVTAVFMPSEAIWFGVRAPKRRRRAADLPGVSAFAARASRDGSGDVCGAVCADESTALRVFRL